MKVVSLFSGAGGLDKGFEEAGMEIILANEFDKKIHSTFRRNFPDTILDTRSIVDIDAKEIPDCDGIIGGPPCQSWSEAGALRGIDDERGQLFFEYIRILREKKPKFFLAENVSGMLFRRHNEAIDNILKRFQNLDYHVRYCILNSHNYGVPQTRERVIFVGYHKDYGKYFDAPEIDPEQSTLKDAIWDLRKNAMPALDKNKTNPKVKFQNHEYMIGGFSTIYMSRNRVRRWDQPSFTIQAGGRHAPCHPQAPTMELLTKDVRKFVSGKEHLYRRLSVRECARVQTFPDDFIFDYDRVADGYKMIGNAVPVKFAHHLAKKIKSDLHKKRRNKKFSKMEATAQQIKDYDEKQLRLQI